MEQERTRYKLTRLAALALTCAMLASCGAPSNGADADRENFPQSGAGGAVGPGQKPLPGQDVQGEKNFAFLVNNYAEGRPANKPWAGAWWAFSNGQDMYGIASGRFGNGVSPAGKYDAVRGLTGNASAQNWEAKYHGPDPATPGGPEVEGWWGHCNGWSGAAALFPEPTQPVKVNGLEFSVADIKALITEASMAVKADFFGNKMEKYHRIGSAAQMDVIPAQMFLVLTNYMGIKKRVVNIDEDTGSQVWNQPLAGYNITYPKPSDYKGQVPGKGYVVEVQMKIWWMRDDVAPDHVSEPFDFKSWGNDSINSREFKMELWLDGPIVWEGDRMITSGDVIVTRKPDGEYGEHVFEGGKYIGIRNSWDGENWREATPEACFSNCWPDFMWVPFQVLDKSEYADYGIEVGDVNPNIDIEWVKKYLLTAGDKTDPAGIPNPKPAPAPKPKPKPSALPAPGGNPGTQPSPRPSVTPNPTGAPNPLG